MDISRLFAAVDGNEGVNGTPPVQKIECLTWARTSLAGMPHENASNNTKGEGRLAELILS
jgi:hypothetical protein